MKHILGKAILAVAFLASGAVAAPFLQVDLNGGNAGELKPGESGWSQWGGGADTGNPLPNSSDGTTAATATHPAFASTEGNVGVTLKALGGTGVINSRDRGAPSGTLGNVYRDLIFVGAASNVQSRNLIEADFSGLQPNKAYSIALYSFDTTGNHTMNWTSTTPTAEGTGALGYTVGGTYTRPANTGTFAWTSGQTAGLAPVSVDVTTNASGAFSVFGFGGSGVTADQNADTSYLNGFAISVAPEPASLVTIGAAAIGAIARRRKA